MWCGILNWVLGQKKDINGKTVEIQIQSGVLVIVMCEHSFLGFDVLWLRTMLTLEETGRRGEGYVGTLYSL